MANKAVKHHAFDKVKSCLTNEPVLSLFQQGREHVIQTDACNEQIGATLLQREDDRSYTQFCMLAENYFLEKQDMQYPRRRLWPYFGQSTSFISIFLGPGLPFRPTARHLPF